LYPEALLRKISAQIYSRKPRNKRTDQDWKSNLRQAIQSNEALLRNISGQIEIQTYGHKKSPGLIKSPELRFVRPEGTNILHIRASKYAFKTIEM
jgi:hypothetical protein